MSHLKQQLTIQQVTRAKVIAVLGITEMAYNSFQYDQGMAYLEEQLGGTVIGKEQAETPLYWAWWRNHWHDTDAGFLQEVKYMSQPERQQWYEMAHDLKAFRYKPQKAILVETLKQLKNKKIIKHQL